MFNIPTVTVAKTTLDSTSDSVTLTYVAPSVAWTPRHLYVRINSKAESGQPSNNMRFNGDTGSNYNRQHMQGSGSTASAGRNTNGTGIHAGQNESGSYEFGTTEILIPDALSTRSHKATIALNGATEDSMQAIAGRWASTAAITSVTIYTSGVHYSVGSTFQLCVVDESFSIDEQIKTGDGTFTVGSIAAADGDLVTIGNLRSTRDSGVDTASLYFNSDTTSGNYPSQRLHGSDTTVAAASLSNRVAATAAAQNTTGAFGALVIQMSNTSDGSNDPIIVSHGGYHGDSSTSRVSTYSQRWNNVAAVTAFELDADNGDWLTGSMLSTYAVPKNLIARQELTSDTRDVTFSSIPQTYDHLELTMYAKRDRNSTSDSTFMYFNGDTTDANYDFQKILGGSGTNVSAQTHASSAYIGQNTASSSAANIFASLTVTIQNYTKTDRHKSRMVTNGESKDSQTILFSSRWESTAAITTILTHGSGSTHKFTAGSVFELRGISADILAPASDIAEVNTIALADIQAMNGITVANAEKLNGITF